MRVLFATAEAWPLAKTGGLGDVAFGLTRALAELDCDVRLLMPAYPGTVEQLEGEVRRHTAELAGEGVTLIEGRLPGTGVGVWLLDDPPLFARVGGPYATAGGDAWPDNHWRFLRLSQVAAALAAGDLLDWRAEVLHGNDWQTALAPVFLRDRADRPATVFGIHNLAYRGLFPAELYPRLGLPAELWQPEGLEFYGQLAFIKGSLVFADTLVTVSPTYAREIQTPAFGWGLDGLLHHRRDRLFGIVNGIDTATWDPGSDRHLVAQYTGPDDRARAANRRAVARAVGLSEGEGPILGFVGRLVEQKGVDLILAALPRLLAAGAQLALLGAGDHRLETALRAAAEQHPGQVGVVIGYDEALAHQIEAGSDLFLMPSRFEPCGLNQLYSLRYGTPPVVYPTGGLADTVVDVDAHPQSGNGFHLAASDGAALAAAVERALAHWQDRPTWHAIQARGMAGTYSWAASAQAYQDLYRQVVASRG
ncbi:glycogen synthase GlgA [Halorhodospira halophila]|uniref:Glycogen synthase n=1 Tax=Halorhodospira halophila (strain DSM 244 / SL1) TaxID=349124 RepID=GLGA_HALHL|nr:glycogen synthase GlgA [Halorhodospira halophila]A1WW18.1 RecName: Full=Glycogen synthase; AltName: Full=Starch [bacterial glycogen] synthase [Halorhodospira halophila SL1]ABM61880.1 glycogen/starch synthase, ADP-glucose type [Halorhodospira halophila SL1]MBK1729866.1 glycogen synthase [Halorhodospira halophila]